MPVYLLRLCRGWVLWAVAFAALVLSQTGLSQVEVNWNAEFDSASGGELTRGYRFKTVSGSKSVWYKVNGTGSAVATTATEAGNLQELRRQVLVGWSGLSAENTPVDGVLTPAQTLTFITVSTTTSAGPYDLTIAMPVPDVPVHINHTPGGNTFRTYALPPIEVIVAPDGSVSVVDPLASDPEPEPENPLEDWAGRQLNVPIYVEDGAETVTVEIGGETYTFPVDSEDLAEGGLAWLAVTIPPNWDGMAKINGQDVALAPRTAYTGDPRMAMMANPYADPDSQLPPGMTWGKVEMPPGMDKGKKLVLPEGVTKVTIGGAVGGNLPTGVTKVDGSTEWHYDNLTIVKPAAGGGPTVISSKAKKSDKGDGIGEGDADGGEAARDAAVDAGASTGFNGGGDPTLPGSGLAGIGNQWSNLKTEIEGKIGGFSPLASGSIPRVDALTYDANAGPWDLNFTLDFTKEPFVTGRAIMLVVITFHAGMSFLRFLQV